MKDIDPIINHLVNISKIEARGELMTANKKYWINKLNTINNDRFN